MAAALARHGISAGPDDTTETLRERLNERYLEEVRALRERQRGGEIPLREYGTHVQALRDRFELLSLPPSLWVD